MRWRRAGAELLPEPARIAAEGAHAKAVEREDRRSEQFGIMRPACERGFVTQLGVLEACPRGLRHGANFVPQGYCPFEGGGGTGRVPGQRFGRASQAIQEHAPARHEDDATLNGRRHGGKRARCHLPKARRLARFDASGYGHQREEIDLAPPGHAPRLGGKFVADLSNIPRPRADGGGERPGGAAPDHPGEEFHGVVGRLEIAAKVAGVGQRGIEHGSGEGVA